MLGPYFMDIYPPPPPPSPIVNETNNVKEVWSGKQWYSSMRHEYQRAVCVMWEDDTITVEPISNLIDFVNREVCKKAIPVLYNWKVSVQNKLCKTKLCAFCINERKHDNFLCQDCEKSTEWLNLFINNEQIIRENIYISERYFGETKSIKSIKSIESPSPLCIKVPESLLRKRKYPELEENLKNLDRLLMDISI